MLTIKARLVVAFAVLGGFVTLGFTVRSLSTTGMADEAVWATLAFTALVAASWVWPLVLFREGHSETVHLDEGFFVIMALVLPAGGAILAFGLAVLVAQIVRRHLFVKSLFNVGQMLLSVGLGIFVAHLIASPRPPLSARDLLAAAAGSVTFFVVNSLLMVAIFITTGSNDLRSAVLDGLDVRAGLLLASVTIGLATASSASGHLWFVPLAAAPVLVLRHVLAGHFRARHDRTRMRGLFEATLEANKSFGESDVTVTITNAAQSLLRCSTAQLTDAPPTGDTLGTAVDANGHQRWLVVSGRSPSEPFDSQDASLLEALGAVGAGALTNATLYREGRHQRERLAAITGSLGEGVCAVDHRTRLTFMNPAAAEMLGWHDSPVQHVLETSGADAQDAPPFLSAPAVRAMSARTTVRVFDTTFQKEDGTAFPVELTASPILEDDDIAGAVLVFRDITERKELEEQLARHAFEDALTGLANRRVFLDHVGQAVQRSERSNETHAVLFADVDRFKVVNDSLGHHAGDQLLIAIAHRVSEVLRPGDLLARLGGDEFTVLLQGVEGVHEAVSVAGRILNALREPIRLPDGHEIVSSLSIGIALTTGGKSKDDVLRDADVAMYQAKAKGRGGNYVVFDGAAMGARSAERLELETGLRHAIDRGELEVYYQPLFDISTGRITGAEALARWNHPTRGVVGPDEFITLAEETGLILPIGQYVLEQACQKSREWLDLFGTRLTMSVNLSARQFQQPDLLDQVRAILHESRVNAPQICLEITESLAMDDVDLTAKVLTNLHELGIRWAIDDFGTGYSSLSYLKRFPVDVVKIDRSFVDGLETNEVDTAIVVAVIGLARTLKMMTVAEGVETVEQLDHLRRVGCDVAQGFYLARPLPAVDMEALIGPPLRTGRRPITDELAALFTPADIAV